MAPAAKPAMTTDGHEFTRRGLWRHIHAPIQ
jgi:hypothetical protein